MKIHSPRARIFPLYIPRIYSAPPHNVRRRRLPKKSEAVQNDSVQGGKASAAARAQPDEQRRGQAGGQRREKPHAE